MKSPADGNESRAAVLPSIATAVQVVSVLVAAVISILSFNNVRVHEIAARTEEARKRDVEAARPFLDLRGKRYLETLEVIGVLATGEPRMATENGEPKTILDVGAARRRFEQLYWVELALVESRDVEAAMVTMRRALLALEKPAGDAVKDTPEAEKQRKRLEEAKGQAAIGVAHAIRDSLAESWGIVERVPGLEHR